MSKRSMRAAARAVTGKSPIANPRALFNQDSGRWATAMFKKAILEGRDLSAQVLRTLDTLRHEEWKHFDDALVEEQLIRLVGVGDLIARGLTRPVANSLGKMVFAYEKVDFMDPAEISLDGLSRTPNDRVEFSLNQMPLPIIHKDFFLNLRVLTASRDKGEALDTTQVRMAGRVVSEAAESMLFDGGPTYGNMPIYGYRTFPDRKQDTFDGGKSWDDPAKDGPSFLKDIMNALATLGSATNRAYGPYVVYVPTLAGVNIENDFNPGTSDTRTIRQRILSTQQISDIRVADAMAADEVLFVQMDANTVVWVAGEGLQTVQWDEGGGFTINFKAFQIGAPLIRSDAKSRSGIFHLTK